MSCVKDHNSGIWKEYRIALFLRFIKLKTVRYAPLKSDVMFLILGVIN